MASIPSREPGTYRDLFTVFAEEEILDADLAERMGEMAGFRSVLAHDYADIDHDRVHEHLEHLDRFREFAAAIHAHVDD